MAPPERILACIAVAMLVGAPVEAGEVMLRDVLTDPQQYDGRSVVLTGTLAKLTTRSSRTRARPYTLDLSDGTRAIAVVVEGRPACPAGSRITGARARGHDTPGSPGLRNDPRVARRVRVTRMDALLDFLDKERRPAEKGAR